ncbi:lasso peptide biosynthesis B2 protein [Amycolatopsis magusensis]|uniref:lasso peptide biosynthesis B2 protein n=1 Tax=Amycolatopsis magusensis TaxID=882444 RepID=UPI0024A88786|nr:lasso peptide biosynthesis B2 protein [Amycolatopsis magusensis]MDI5980185.1 lasso peptide biosynthesis B2 protein [Amycolatopsis magusensis]
MTLPITLETADRVPLPKRLVAHAAVAVARILMHAKPFRLRRALELAKSGARRSTAEQAMAARQAVVSVSRRCAGQQCLQRAIATALLCRSAGTWPDWRTGVRTEPFRAHAWVEVDGKAIGEAEDMRAYHVVLSVPA